MNVAVGLLVKETAIRMAKILGSILLGVMLLGFMGCRSATQTVTVMEMQSGGSGLLATASGSVFDTGGITTPAPGSPDFGAIVSDADRYRLATEAGFSPADAITAVAVSIAENQSGDPSLVSKLNDNRTVDIGLWQINSSREFEFGGKEALKIPATNARATRVIFLEGGWCRWFTYEVGCGPNHTGSYRQYLARAQKAALPQPWHDLPAFNQYDRNNWGNPQNFAIWSPAACSAAALRWMLTAYGHPLSSIDEAVLLIGPYTGITPAQGLSDHTGPGLVSALGKAGFKGWNAHLNNKDELRQRIALGPLMMDGFKWFGVGHWFVGMGSDDNGIFIRESSGNNVTYLTWARLYGEVGWSGWVVGIQTAPQVSNQA